MRVESVDAGLSEEYSRKEHPEEIVVDIASQKKRAYLETMVPTPGKVLLAADTAVFLEGRQLGKPRDEGDAVRMLQALSGNWHEVLTGVDLRIFFEKGGVQDVFFCEKTRVKFRRLPHSSIVAYATSKIPLDKAGAYGIQDYGALFVESIVGDFYNVMGLPLGRIWEVLKDYEVLV